MNKEFNDVKKFHEAFGHPISTTPTALSKERAIIIHNWMSEEVNEFLEASDEQDIVEQADAMIDTIYFALGTLVEMGIAPDALFAIVQNANMSKLWPDGQPHYNDMGKVIKPTGWEDPHPKLAAAISNMQNNIVDDLTEGSDMIDYQYHEVKKFHEAFGHPTSEVPVNLSKYRAVKRASWLLEEINEFLEASDEQDIVEQADAMIDTIYFALGTLVEMGITPGLLFKAIQKANMSKIWPDGEVHYNKRGKIIKPDGWEDPHMQLKIIINNM